MTTHLACAGVNASHPPAAPPGQFMRNFQYPPSTRCALTVQLPPDMSLNVTLTYLHMEYPMDRLDVYLTEVPAHDQASTMTEESDYSLSTAANNTNLVFTPSEGVLLT